MKPLGIFCIGITLMLFACKKKMQTDVTFVSPMPDTLLLAEDTLPWTIYHIPQGAHYSLEDTFSFFPFDTLLFRLSFDESARYKNKNPINQLDWNKLLGFSDCGSHHQQNSARLVWRYDTNMHKVELGWYTYRNVLREYATLDTIAIHDTAKALLFRTDQVYGFQVGEKLITLDRPCKNRPLSYVLFPYFGGDEKAPQDIQLHLQHLAPVNL